MKLIKQGVAVLAASLISVTSSADILGASAAFTYWAPDSSGDIQSGGDKIDIDKNLGLGGEEFMIFTAALEHPVPLLPNVRFQYFDMDQVAHGSLNNVNFNGQNFNGNVQTSLDLSHYDFTLYYEILDNWVNLDLGVTAKVFDGLLLMRDQTSGNTSRTDIDEIIPMLYGSAVFDFPITSLSAGVEGSAISLGGDTVYDMVAKLRFRAGLLGLEAGYRAIGVEVDDISNIDVDTQIDGPYVSAMLVF